MNGKFNVYCALEAYEKADAADGQTMRIGGVVSTDSVDLQGEQLVQEGMDFKPFLNRGWFNDNHKQGSADVLGYPTSAKFVRKGDALPNGKVAAQNGWWAEGYLVDTPKGREIWELTRALQHTPRSLGFSVEGKVKARGSDPSKIARAEVSNVAITHCPVNTDTAMHALAKALTAGSAIANPGAAPGEGFALRVSSMAQPEAATPDEWEAALTNAVYPTQRVTKSQAIAIVRIRLPHLTEDQARILVDSI